MNQALRLEEGEVVIRTIDICTPLVATQETSLNLIIVSSPF